MIINKSSVLFQYCTFSNSEAGIYSTRSAITVNSCTFVNNSIIGCDGHYSRAVISAVNGHGHQISNSVTITNSDFIDNHYRPPTDYDDDDIIDGINSIVFIDDSTLILNNSVVNNSGFNELLHMNTKYSQMVMDHNNFCNNKVYDAAVYIDATNISITVSHNNFTDNNATALLLHVSYGRVKISDSNFIRNRQSSI